MTDDDAIVAFWELLQDAATVGIAQLEAADVDTQDFYYRHAVATKEWCAEAVERVSRRHEPREEIPEEIRVRQDWEARNDRTKEVWTSQPFEVKAKLIAGALVEEPLLARELADKLDADLRTPDCGIYHVIKETNLRATLARMVQIGQLDRTPETYRRNCARVRYRYSIRRALEGTILELERALEAS